MLNISKENQFFHINYIYMLPLICLAMMFTREARATPRMSLSAGTPCSGCHYSNNGGGGRTDLGWSSMSRAGALTYDQIGLKALHDQHSSVIADMVTVGADVRLQVGRFGVPYLDEASGEVKYPDISSIPMQFQPYLALTPVEGLIVYGSILPGPGAMEGDLNEQGFPGMSPYEYWASYSFSPSLPTIRIGKFQPTFGIRHDDHTILQRGDALTTRVPVIPPNFTEMGAEISYRPLRFLQADLGGFRTVQLQEVFDKRVNEELELAPFAIASRVTVYPHITLGEKEEDDDDDDNDNDDDDDFGEDEEEATPVNLNGWFGLSSYWSKEFHLLNGFIGIGTSFGLSGVAEVAFRDNPNSSQKIFQQLNALFGLNYAFKNWLVFNARVERGQTQRLTTALDEVAVTWQYVAGLEFFPIPYVEIRPEYRLVDTYDYRFGQAMVQVHLFY